MNRVIIKKIKSILFLIFAGLFSFLVFSNTIKAASFDFSPSNANFYKECEYTVNIEADVTGQTSNAADIEINYNPTEVEIIDLLNGNAYEIYFAKEISPTNNRARLAGGSFTELLSSKKIFTTLRFKSKPGITSTTFTIKFDGIGNTLDSNIADASTSADLLTGVTNATYTFSDPPFGSCQADTQPPVINFVYPTNNQTGIPSNATIQFSITDNISGVDLNSLIINLNGVNYTISSSQLSYTGSLLNYTFTLGSDPSNPIKTNEVNVLRIQVRDFAGNLRNQAINFNTTPSIQPTQTPPRPCPTCPETPNCPEPQECEICPEIEECIPVEQEVEKETSSQDQITIIKFIDDLSEKIIPFLDQIPFVRDTYETITKTELLKSLAESNFLTALGLLIAPGLLFNYLTLLALKKRKTWGLVLDITNNKPVEFAICKLFKAGSLTLVEQTLSDSEGKYGFAIIPGAYRLEVIKNGYEKEIQKLIIQEDEKGYVKDVKITPKNMKAKLQAQVEHPIVTTLKLFFTNLFKKLLPFLFIVGLTLCIIKLFNKPNDIINLIIFFLYLIYIIFSLLTRYDLRTKYGLIIDSAHALRVPNALIKIFNMESGDLIDTKISNSNGNFDFWGKPGEYAVHVSLRGYKYPSNIQTEHPKVFINSLEMLRMKFRQGKNKIKILLDPLG